MVFQTINTFQKFLRHDDVEKIAEIADLCQVRFRVFVQPHFFLSDFTTLAWIFMELVLKNQFDCF